MNRKTLSVVVKMVLLYFCFIVGFAVVNLTAKTLPSHVGIASVYFVLTASFFMIVIVLHQIRNNKKSLQLTISTLAVFAVVEFATAIDKPKAVVYDTKVMVFLSLIACGLAIFPFIISQRVLCFPEDHAKRDSIYFGASIMWLSTLFADMIFLIKWSVQGILLERLEYMTLGGGGFNDVLFFYGAIAFLTLTLFHLITPHFPLIN